MGGLPPIMKTLLEAGLLHGDCITGVLTSWDFPVVGCYCAVRWEADLPLCNLHPTLARSDWKDTGAKPRGREPVRILYWETVSHADTFALSAALIC